jgi:hypothetical protein
LATPIGGVGWFSILPRRIWRFVTNLFKGKKDDDEAAPPLPTEEP